MPQFYVGVVVTPGHRRDAPPVAILSTGPIDAPGAAEAALIGGPLIRAVIPPNINVPLLVESRDQWTSCIADHQAIYSQQFYTVVQEINGTQHNSQRLRASSPQEALDDYHGMLPELRQGATPRVLRSTLVPTARKAQPTPPEPAQTARHTNLERVLLGEMV